MNRDTAVAEKLRRRDLAQESYERLRFLIALHSANHADPSVDEEILNSMKKSLRIFREQALILEMEIQLDEEEC
jgi:hypothetical protein